mgnify:CR=1 FL=1
MYGLCLHYQVVTASYALIHQAQASPRTPPNGNNKDVYCSNILDVAKLKQTIQSGRVYQHPNFLSEEEVQLLWKEIIDLESSGAFTRSGLSNLARGAQQQFGNKDRSLCPVPWWQETLEGKPVTNTQQEGMQALATRLQDLRLALSDILDRPTMTDASLAHECYYSMSTVGSHLPRHMDERHEELKGAKGWLLPSRRSLSWLVYLSEPEDWSLETNGGALRTFPPKNIGNNALSLTHDEGNLQIGWLLGDSTGKEDEMSSAKAARPVYLDSWHPVVAQPNTPPEPHCVLYTREGLGKEKRILTLPWITEDIQGISIPEFLMRWAQRQSSGDISEGLFLRPQDAQQFALLEDRTAWDNGKIPEGSTVEDIAPLRGSLVVFDSVTLPHQVETIQQGRRVALAGWFHEETQPFPEAMYS